MGTRSWTLMLLACCAALQVGMAHMLWVDHFEFKPAQGRAQTEKEKFDAAHVRSDIDGQEVALDQWREALADECRALRKEFLVFPDCRAYNLDP